MSTDMPNLDAENQELGSLQEAFVEKSRREQETVVERLSDLGVQLLSRDEAAAHIRLAAPSDLEAQDQVVLSIVHNGETLYPSFQFCDGMQRPWLGGMLVRVADGWSLVSFLTARRYSLAGKSHLERILAEEPGAVETAVADFDSYLS